MSASTDSRGGSTANSLANGTVIGDHFVIRRKLGGGGMGEVYLAENLNIQGKQYAIKVLLRQFSNDPRFASMLRDEATKQARLEHDNVVGMVDFFPWDGHYCLMQTYVKGQTLSQMLDETPQGLDRNLVLTLMEGVLAGLDYAHENGILHCDVKPANVIVDNEGRPRVTDFGISRDIGAASSALAGAGTVDYMSPEQILPPYDVDHRTDVFSAGALMFQLLCGRLPFSPDPSLGEGVTTQLSHDAPDVRRYRPDVPEPVARIVATALLRKPEMRFQGCGDFRKAIVDFRRRERWRRQWLPAIAVTTVAAIAVGSFLFERQKRLQEEAAANMDRAIAQYVHNEAAALNQLCEGARQFQNTAGNLKIVQSSKDNDPTDTSFDNMIQSLQGKLENWRQVVGKQASQYGDVVQQLGNQDVKLVADIMGRESHADSLVGVFFDTMTSDDAAVRAGRSLPNVDAMVARCPAAMSAPTPTAPARN